MDEKIGGPMTDPCHIPILKISEETAGEEEKGNLYNWTNKMN